MAVSISDLIPRVRAMLNDVPFATQGSATDATSVVAVTDGTDWEEGAIGEFQDNGEQFKVISVAANNLTCFRGWNGTTATAHAASSTILRGALYQYAQINQAITAAVNDLWPYAWKTEAVSVTPLTDGTKWYNLTATCMDLIEVNQRYGSTDKLLGQFGVDGGRSVVFKRNLPTALVASGVGIEFPDGFYKVANVVNITAAARITGTTDIEDTATLPVAEAVITGALARLLMSRQIQRVSKVTQDEALTIGTSARLTTFGALFQEFRIKLLYLLQLHQELYPRMLRWE